LPFIIEIDRFVTKERLYRPLHSILGNRIIPKRLIRIGLCASIDRSATTFATG